MEYWKSAFSELYLILFVHGRTVQSYRSSLQGDRAEKKPLMKYQRDGSNSLPDTSSGIKMRETENRSMDILIQSHPIIRSTAFVHLQWYPPARLELSC